MSVSLFIMCQVWEGINPHCELILILIIVNKFVGSIVIPYSSVGCSLFSNVAYV